MRNTDRHLGYRLAAALALAAVLLTASGCVPASSETSATGPVSNPHGASTVKPPRIDAPRPPAPDLSAPIPAVRSYLDWVSYAYLLGNSDVATPTMTPGEEVRVNSYVELGKQKNQRIEQKLVSFVPGRVSVESTRVLVPVRERWQYRYVPYDGKGSATPTYTASYETTYTLILMAPRRWLVDFVEVRSLGQVK